MADNYQPAQNALLPIVRDKSDVILAAYNKSSATLYNSPTPYTDYGSIGPKQPFVYIKASDSTVSRNLTKYDSQVLPIGSTIRDLERIGQFSVTGNGLLFYGKQLLLQKQNAFNETRIYNPLSVLKATAKPGSAGLIDYPQRHLETSGGLLNFFKDALMSTLGLQTKNSDNAPIEGTATGTLGELAWSTYAKQHGGARAGLLRFGTADAALTNFDRYWATNTQSTSGGSKGGFLANLGNALISKAKSMIPSTNPLGAFGGSPGTKWEFRPEYPTGKAGIYVKFLTDSNGFFTTNTIPVSQFYNGKVEATEDKKTALDYQKYTPSDNTTTSPAANTTSGTTAYATTGRIERDAVGEMGSSIKITYKDMLSAMESFKSNVRPQFRPSAERYSEIKDYRDVSYQTYNDIPSTPDGKFESKIGQKDVATMDRMWFAKASSFKDVSNGSTSTNSHDRYNALSLDDLKGKRGQIPYNITGYAQDQSKDVIFFYFFDLVNEVYVPFRATISALSDQHSAEWEDISYLGRADKLFLYKGFSRDMNLAFTVYANSAKEMIPMWERINYLVGLTRPSKYTADRISQEEADMNYEFGGGQTTTGAEGMFIYPPMITLTLGDMYVDQPCVLSSVSMTVPDDANWETLRSDNYNYVASPTKTITLDGVKSRQLPLKVDISVSLKVLEKSLSLGKNAHFGKSTYDDVGNETGKWLLT